MDTLHTDNGAHVPSNLHGGRSLARAGLLVVGGPGLLLVALLLNTPLGHHLQATNYQGKYDMLLMIADAWVLFLLSTFGWPLFSLAGAWVGFKTARAAFAEGQRASGWAGATVCCLGLLSLLYWAFHISYLHLWLSDQAVAEAMRSAH